MDGLVLEPPEPPPEPPEPVEDDPGAVVEPEPERVVPLAAVLALDEVPVEVLELERTVELPELLDEVESAELEFAAELPGVVRPRFPDESAEVDDDAAETPLVEDAESMALPGLGALPEPAPEDEPAVLEAVEPLVELVCDDWM